MGQAFGRHFLVPLLGEFLARYPRVVPDWHFDNRQVDLVGEGFDAAIGGGFALASGVVARELAPVHIVAVASPAYLAGRPLPRTPGGPRRRSTASCGARRRPAACGRGRCARAAAPSRPVPCRPRLIFSDPEAIAQAARLGLGVALLPMPFAFASIARASWCGCCRAGTATPGRSRSTTRADSMLPAKTRVFVDFVVERFRLGRIRAAGRRALRCRGHRRRVATKEISMANVKLNVNGVAKSVDAWDPEMPLLYVLRNDARPARGRNSAAASASAAPAPCCVDGTPVRSCTLPVIGRRRHAASSPLEGLGTPEQPHPVQAAFIAEQAAQCGYCTNGMVMSAVALLERMPQPTREEAQQALDGSLCRCGTHVRVLRAVLRAADGGEDLSMTRRLDRQPRFAATLTPRACSRPARSWSASASRPRALRKRSGAADALAQLPLDQVDRFFAVHRDGSVTSIRGKVDLGTGLRIAMRQMAAEELGDRRRAHRAGRGRHRADARPGVDRRQHRHHARRRAAAPGGGDGARGAARAGGRAAAAAGRRARRGRRRGARRATAATASASAS